MEKGLVSLKSISQGSIQEPKSQNNEEEMFVLCNPPYGVVSGENPLISALKGLLWIELVLSCFPS